MACEKYALDKILISLEQAECENENHIQQDTIFMKSF